MDELETVLADTSSEELTAQKKIQYINVSWRFLHFTSVSLGLVIILKSHLYSTMKFMDTEAPVCIFLQISAVDKLP